MRASRRTSRSPSAASTRGELPGFAVELAAGHSLQSLLAQHRTGRAQAVEEAGHDRALHAPLSTPPRTLGPAARPGLYYTHRVDGEPAASGWEPLERLMRHLRGGVSSANDLGSD